MATGTLVLTGFGPFGNVTENPSWLIAKSFQGKEINGLQVHTCELPVTYGMYFFCAGCVLGVGVPTDIYCIG